MLTHIPKQKQQHCAAIFCVRLQRRCNAQVGCCCFSSSVRSLSHMRVTQVTIKMLKATTLWCVHATERLLTARQSFAHFYYVCLASFLASANLRCSAACRYASCFWRVVARRLDRVGRCLQSPQCWS